MVGKEKKRKCILIITCSFQEGMSRRRYIDKETPSAWRQRKQGHDG